MERFRPKIDLPLTKRAKSFEIACLLVLVLLWASTLFVYFSSPDIIPVHFNAHGKPDGYGSKGFLFVTTGIGTGLYFLLTIMNKYPHNFNYLVTITPENAEKQYSMATGMLRVVKLCVLLLMLVITIQTSPFGEKHLSGYFFLFLIMGLVVATPVIVAVFMEKMVRKNKTTGQ